MTHTFITDEDKAKTIVKRVMEIEPRIYCYVDGGLIKGSFRGKDTFIYSIDTKNFIYNKASGYAKDAFAKAHQ